MNPRILRTGIAASAIAHLSALALVLFFSDVHPFGSVTAEPIAVDIVPAAELAPSPKKEESVPEPEANPPDGFDLASKPTAPSPPQPPAASPKPTASAPKPAAPPQQQAALPAPAADAQPAASRPRLPPATTPAPAYRPPEPDLSIKYHVMLGLPPDLPPEARGSKPGETSTPRRRRRPTSTPVW